ncbi:MAG: tRNA uridine-5-carboxymethylaminomethyl(34) synthesis enzyme MnmG [Oscillospiraceae bacterium]|jgi:tRNA uridine 5-carboxymethylaminomethyl modification enzyme|nr:tRNA uridine-5-carboxymethylaminomethyl(34) synthesis enzyme MnmG [Oscillospiraceae bacterium]
MNYDIIVIGAGHAGIEACLAAARLGCRVAVFTMNLDYIGNCPCNPSIGGTAKGHLVRELDALGGEMGKTADECFLQSRMLNLGKGPAVHSLRVQIDRNKYKEIMKHKLELQENLEIKQAEIIDLKSDGNLWRVKTLTNMEYTSKCVIIATGTYLGGTIYIGETSFKSGPDYGLPALRLGEALKRLGLSMRKFKTGTPARALKSSINFSALEVQNGDKNIVPFSYRTKDKGENKICCHIGWTNEKTKEIILKNINKSPIYSGKIEGIGPRYCPSIEDKIVRFSDKERHQLFIEPCGLNTEEMYLQGLSSSLPEDVQLEFYRTIKGFENVVIMRPAYAIEYDCADPTQMNSTLEFKEYSGLYGAGQFNGSSGYEEAAVQGFIAGVNAALKTKNKKPLVLDRASSYIGTLIDDLITKGVSDPYRMMTSRSEYRLILRQDNADQRLMPIGRKLGLIPGSIWEEFNLKEKQKQEEIKRVKKVNIYPTSAVNELIKSKESFPIVQSVKLFDLLKRPNISYKDLKIFDSESPNLSDEILKQIEIEIKYEGYINRQLRQVEEMRRLEKKQIPENFNYGEIKGLRLEAVEKLKKIKPESLGQASRISGVSPSDVSVLMVWLSRK